MRNWCGKRWGGSLLWDKLGGRWRNGHPALPRRLLSVSPDLRLEVGQQQNFHICPHNFTNVMNLEVKGGPMSYSFGNQPFSDLSTHGCGSHQYRPPISGIQQLLDHGKDFCLYIFVFTRPRSQPSESFHAQLCLDLNIYITCCQWIVLL